jgi:hypothetical protein
MRLEVWLDDPGPRPVFNEAWEMVMGVLAEKERLVRSPLSHSLLFPSLVAFNVMFFNQRGSSIFRRPHI